MGGRFGRYREKFSLYFFVIQVQTSEIWVESETDSDLTVAELDEFLQDLDEDVEGMQGTIYFLQQELRRAKEVERTEPAVPNGRSERTDRGIRRTLSDDSDGEDAPLSKKGRRSSELSVEFNEEELGLTNGDSKEDDR